MLSHFALLSVKSFLTLSHFACLLAGGPIMSIMHLKVHNGHDEGPPGPVISFFASPGLFKRV